MVKKSKTPALINPDQSVSDVFASILQHNFDYLLQWEQAAYSFDNIEGVHQTRVTFRRMRSALSTFRGAVPRKVSATWGEEMRWLAGELGAARDLDVFIDEALGDVAGKLPLPGGDALMSLALEKRAEAYGHVREMWDGERFGHFKEAFPAWLSERGWEQAELKKKQRKALEQHITPFAREVLDKQERKVLGAGTHVDKTAPEDMHRLRIECKKLRYATEFFTPLFGGMEDFMLHMKGLQDILGVMNDVAVMNGLVSNLLEGADDQEPHQYAGGVIGWRTRHYHELLGSFDASWEEFVSAKHPWWNKSGRN